MSLEQLKERRENLPELLKALKPEGKKQLLHVYYNKSAIVDDMIDIIETDILGK